MKRRIGCYAGSFNPFHVGHYNIYQQALKQFDNVILSVGQNPSKDGIERISKIPHCIDTVSFYSGLLSDELKRLERAWGCDVTLVRGLRNIYDLNAEQNMLAFVRAMYPELKVIYFMCEPQFAHISSSALRDIQKFSDAEYQKYLVHSKKETWYGDGVIGKQ